MKLFQSRFDFLTKRNNKVEKKLKKNIYLFKELFIYLLKDKVYQIKHSICIQSVYIMTFKVSTMGSILYLTVKYLLCVYGNYMVAMAFRSRKYALSFSASSSKNSSTSVVGKRSTQDAIIPSAVAG